MRDPAEFGEEGLQMGNCLRVTYSVRRQNAVMVLDVRAVIPHLTSKKIGKMPAGLLKDDLRRARVPQLRPR